MPALTLLQTSVQNFLTLQFVGPQTTSSTTRRWNKDVDRSLYGSREYASKNPALSPITERLSFITQSPTAQETRSISCKGKKKLPVVGDGINVWMSNFILVPKK